MIMHTAQTYGPQTNYAAASNLHLRTNNALIQTFNVSDLNELTTAEHGVKGSVDRIAE